MYQRNTLPNKMKHKYQLRNKTKYQSKQKKPEKGIQFGWVTGEAASNVAETEAADNSSKRRSPSSSKISIILNKLLIRAIFPIY